MVNVIPLFHLPCLQIAFHPKFLASRVEKERRAILSELQMMNTIEYRVDCQVKSREIIFLLISSIYSQLFLVSNILIQFSHFCCSYCNIFILRTSLAEGFQLDWKNRLRNGMLIKLGNSMSVGTSPQMLPYIL